MSELSGRQLELWTKIATAVGQLRDQIDRLDDAGLAKTCAGEGWSVALVGCHVALGLHRQANWVRRVLAGSGPTVFDWERTHALNALIARRVVRPGRADVLRGLDEGLERWRALLERATDEDLARIAFRQGENVRPVEWVAGSVAPRHIVEHTRSIRAAVATRSP